MAEDLIGLGKSVQGVASIANKAIEMNWKRYETEQRNYARRLESLKGISSHYIDEASEVIHAYDRPFWRLSGKIKTGKGKNEDYISWKLDSSIMSSVYLQMLAHNMGGAISHATTTIADGIYSESTFGYFYNKDGSPTGLLLGLTWATEFLSFMGKESEAIFRELAREDMLARVTPLYSRVPPGGLFGEVPVFGTPDKMEPAPWQMADQSINEIVNMVNRYAPILEYNARVDAGLVPTGPGADPTAARLKQVEDMYARTGQTQPQTVINNWNAEVDRQNKEKK